MTSNPDLECVLTYYKAGMTQLRYGRSFARISVNKPKLCTILKTIVINLTLSLVKGGSRTGLKSLWGLFL